MSNPEEFSDRLHNAQQLLGARLFPAAEREIAWLLAHNPGDTDVKLALMELTLGQQKYADLKRLATEFVSQHPGDKEALYYLAVSLEQLGDSPAALDIWYGLLRESPGDPHYNINLASTLLWNYGLEISLDEVEVHLNRGLKELPLNKLGLYTAFWLAERKDQLERMSNVLAQITSAYPEDQMSAMVLANFIRLFRPKDQQRIPQLLRHFPNDPELLRLSKKIYEEKQAASVGVEKFYEIFGSPLPDWAIGAGLKESDLENVEHVLRTAKESGPSFSVRKLAGTLLAVDVHQTAAFLEGILNSNSTRQQRKQILPLFKYLLAKQAERGSVDHFIRLIFEKQFVEMFSAALTSSWSQPSAETWVSIWKDVTERPQLFELVLERHGQFTHPPAVPVSQLIIENKVRPAVVAIMARQKNSQPDLGFELWALFNEQGASLASLDRETLLELVARCLVVKETDGPRLSSLLLATVSNAENLKLKAYSDLLEKLAWLPSELKAKLEFGQTFFAAQERAFANVFLDVNAPYVQATLNFLAQSPYTENVYVSKRAELERQLGLATDAQIRQLLQNVLDRLPGALSEVEKERANITEARAELEREKREMVAREAAGQVSLRVGQVQAIQASIAALQSSYQIECVSIQGSDVPQSEKTLRLTEATAAFQKNLATLLEKLNQ